MEKRRQQKRPNTQKYRQIHKVIKRKIREAKERYMEQNCREVKNLAARYDNFNLHKKIKKMTGLRRKRQQGTIKDKDGNIIIDLSAKLKRCEEYIKELFYDARANTTEMADELRIINQEIEFAIRNAKVNKVVVPDQIPVELLN
ncbi:hypothetical protein ILUMI_24073 [Ignelater luminosus]|uniref:Uncharacterized protein n=1 Tax=Ignelater luminosus TaxID=2038154 RepID=A0A8K0CE35_IGNLU|nr:hypothetical protein ILUMI_24073 [Ignelater luminosus]